MTTAQLPLRLPELTLEEHELCLMKYLGDYANDLTGLDGHILLCYTSVMEHLIKQSFLYLTTDTFRYVLRQLTPSEILDEILKDFKAQDYGTNQRRRTRKTPHTYR